MQDLPGNDLLELVVRYIGLEHIPRGLSLYKSIIYGSIWIWVLALTYLDV
jgi:hypothetical protein